MEGASALVPLNDCEWQEIKNKVTLEALLAMMLAMCQGLTEEDEKVFADFELECFRDWKSHWGPYNDPFGSERRSTI